MQSNNDNDNSNDTTNTTNVSVTDNDDPLSKRYEEVNRLKTQSEIVAFIKGDAARPFCKFSKQLISLLVSNGIVFTAVNVKSQELVDDELYEAIKKLANWPMFPQLYLDGNLIGGLDVVREELEEGTLMKQIEQVQQKCDKQLIYQFNKENSDDDNSSILIQIRLSNGVMVAKEFSLDDTFNSVFVFAAEQEVKHLGSTDLKSFVLCVPWPFQAFDSRSLNSTLRESGFTSTNVAMTLFYPPSESEQTTSVAPATTETITINKQSALQSNWPLIMFGASCAAMLAIAFLRSKSKGSAS